jgi:hypothetical protein
MAGTSAAAGVEGEAVAGLTGELGTHEGAAGDSESAEGDLESQVDDTAEAFEDAETALRDLIGAYQEHVSGVLGAIGTELQQQQALDDLRADFVKAREEGLEPNTEAYRNLQESVLDVLNREVELAVHQEGTLDGAMKRIRTRAGELSTEFPELAGFIGDTVTEIERFPPELALALDDAKFRSTASALAVEVPALGEQIGDELEAGVERGFSSLNLAEIARERIAAVKRETRIFSPSKLTEEQIGRPLGEGVAIGFEKGIGDLTGALDLGRLATVPMTSTSGPGLVAGDTYVTVLLDGEPVRAIVRVEQREHDRALSGELAAGRRP